MRKNVRGITLIALIITVIVLLILAGTAISIALNGGDIFSKTAQAREEWNISVSKENKIINDYLNYLDYYSNGDVPTPSEYSEEEAIPSIFKYELVDSQSGKINGIDGAYELGKVADLDDNINLADNDSDPEVKIVGLNWEFIFKDIQGFVYGTTTASEIVEAQTPYKNALTPYLSNLVIPSTIYIDGEGNFNENTGTRCVVTEIEDMSGEDLYGVISRPQEGGVIDADINVKLPNTIKKIDDRAFFEFTRLKSITFGNGLETIGKRAFENCRNLTTINLPNSLEVIDDCAFSVCVSLTNLSFGNNLRVIKDMAFNWCSSLTNVNLPNGLEELGGYAFSATSITSVYIPASVTKIGRSNPFAKCENITSIIVDTNNTKYNSRNNCNAIIETASNRLISGCENTIFVDGIRTIGDCAFENYAVPANIVLPSSVTTIGFRAFAECTGLQSIVMQDGLQTIGMQAFEDTPKNSTYIVPASVTSIGVNAFGSGGLIYCSPITVYYRGTQEQWDNYTNGQSVDVNRTVHVVPNYTD